MLSDMTAEELKEFIKSQNVYSQVIDDKAPTKYVAMSLVNMTEQYASRLKMVSLLMYLDRALVEKKPMLTEATGVQSVDNDTQYAIIEGFLKNVLHYDSKSASHTTPSVDKLELFEHYPSLQTYGNWQRFEDANLEELRKLMQELYLNYMPQFKSMVQIHNVFDTREQAVSYAFEHSQDLKTTIDVIETKKWALFENNKESLKNDVYTEKDSQFLNSMVKKMLTDVEQASELKRARTQQQEKMTEEVKSDYELRKQQMLAMSSF